MNQIQDLTMTGPSSVGFPGGNPESEGIPSCPPMPSMPMMTNNNNFAFLVNNNNNNINNDSMISSDSKNVLQLTQIMEQPGRKRKAEWTYPAQAPPLQLQQQQQQQAPNMLLKNTCNQIPGSQIEVAAWAAMMGCGNQVAPLPPMSQQQQQLALMNSATSPTMPHQQLQVQVQQQQYPSNLAYSPSILQQLQQQQQQLDFSWTMPTPMQEMASASNLNNNIPKNSMREVLTSGSRQSQRLQTQRAAPRFTVDPQKVLQKFISSAASNGEPSMLHRSLTLFPDNLGFIQGAMELDPRELCRKACVPCESGSSILIKESYGYPLNIALQHEASAEVIELLAKAAPEVILSRDGRDEGGSLLNALRRDPNNAHVLQILIKANPLCLKMRDRRRNTPLHVAVARGASLDVVRALCTLYPAALLKTNLMGETPLEVAQRSIFLCSEKVLNFVQEAYHDELLKD